MNVANESAVTIARMRDVLTRQQRSFLADGPPDAALRIDRLERMIALLTDNRKALCEAISADFGWRSHDFSLMADILLPVNGLKYARKNLRRWMRPERRRSDFGMNWLGARSEVRYQPLGCVGNMVPWNYPLAIAIGPLAEIFAAGNRAMLCLPELSPTSAQLLIELIAKHYDETELAAFVGNAEIGAAFSALPFNHLVFTGSPRVGRLVMKAAADNLTPVTMELGGKSPTIVGRGADLATAAGRIWGGKGLSSGQSCIAPDYVLVHEDDREALIEQMVAAVSTMYPTLRDNPDYTAMATPGQYAHMQRILDDAQARGTRRIEINPAGENLDGTRRIAPTLLVDPPDESLAMQDEIFGPLLPVRSYRRIDEVLDFINARPRPLALYYFGADKTESERVLDNTWSGGACVNEVMQHLMQNDLPFGGCGNSGFGRYRGGEGFKAFSLQRSVYSPPLIDITARMRPPYGERLRKALRFLLER